MQGNRHYDILLGNSFLYKLDKYKNSREEIEIYNENKCIFFRKTTMREIAFPAMVFIIVNILETKLYTCGLIDTGSQITLLKDWKDTKISIKGVTANKGKIAKQKKNVEIMIQNKIVKIRKVYQYNKIEFDITLGNDFLLGVFNFLIGRKFLPYPTLPYSTERLTAKIG